METGLLDGKIALITGASSGIGRSAALLFARHGAKVVLADINVAGGEETAEMVRARSGSARFIEADVSRAEQVEAMIRFAVAEHGRLDCAFNNAGVEEATGPTADCTEESWDRVMSINLKGVWLCMKYEIRQMLVQGGGAIVNNASIAGLVGYPGRPAYAASKHGVVGITRAAAVEYARQNIRINAVCPGAVRTAMIDSLIHEGRLDEQQLAARQPIGRLGSPEEVAESAAWLCSDRASFMVGHALAVDGGRVGGITA